MRILIGITLLLIGVSSVAMATSVPEIDPASGGSALALLSGLLVLVQGRRKR